MSSKAQRVIFYFSSFSWTEKKFVKASSLGSVITSKKGIVAILRSEKTRRWDDIDGTL